MKILKVGSRQLLNQSILYQFIIQVLYKIIILLPEDSKMLSLLSSRIMNFKPAHSW